MLVNSGYIHLLGSPSFHPSFSPPSSLPFQPSSSLIPLLPPYLLPSLPHQDIKAINSMPLPGYIVTPVSSCHHFACHGLHSLALCASTHVQSFHVKYFWYGRVTPAVPGTTPECLSYSGSPRIVQGLPNPGTPLLEYPRTLELHRQSLDCPGTAGVTPASWDTLAEESQVVG